MLQRVLYHVTKTPPIADPITAPQVAPNYNAAPPFYVSDLLDHEGAIKQNVRALVSSDQHKPWAALSMMRSDRQRLINQLPLPKDKDKMIEEVGRVSYADPIGEMVHICVLERFNKPVRVDKGRVMNLFGSKTDYRPYNLVSVLPYIAATYLRSCPEDHPSIDEAARRPRWRDIVEPIYSWREVAVVDWDGRRLDPCVAADAKRIFDLLPSPGQIGLDRMPQPMRLMLRQQGETVAGLAPADEAE
jgi:hypothetical protein